ncbi:hypothetical protein MTO96_019908 [Rhipicephalus appendiculatus]
MVLEKERGSGPRRQPTPWRAGTVVAIGVQLHRLGPPDPKKDDGSPPPHAGLRAVHVPRSCVHDCYQLVGCPGSAGGVGAKAAAALRRRLVSASLAHLGVEW